MPPKDRFPPQSMDPFYEAIERLDDTRGFQVLLNSYGKLIQRALYARKEPDEADASAAEKLLVLAWQT